MTKHYTDKNSISLVRRDFDLQFFAGEKTEAATEKKREDARRSGNVLKSTDLNSVAILLSGFLMLRYYGPQMYKACGDYMRYSFQQLLLSELTFIRTLTIFNQFVLVMIKILSPFLFWIAFVSVAANLAQLGFLFRFEPLTPNIDRLNPVSGLQNVFSWKLVGELGKSVFKIAVVAYIPYSTIRDNIPTLIRFIQLSPLQSYGILLNIVFYMAIKTLLVLLVLAVGDWFFQKWRYEEDLKMSKEDIKEEYKQREGDPKIKQKIKERQRQAASKRMMEEIPNATVVVTNPTHIACAIKYTFGVEDEIPTIVAMGSGQIARRIKEIAAENNIPIRENKPLAQALLKNANIGDEIPEDLWQAVATILAEFFHYGKS
jgi:flagellar biosynthetic protein FlhB